MCFYYNLQSTRFFLRREQDEAIWTSFSDFSS
jgi:hypothetical protein